jgi:hypothetical protein
VDVPHQNASSVEERVAARWIVAGCVIALACGGSGGAGAEGAGERCPAIMCEVPGVSVSVVDARTGVRVADSSLTASGASCLADACGYTAASAPAGTFRCQLPAAGEYALTAQAIGYAPATAMVEETRGDGACNHCLGAPPVTIALSR